MKKASVLIFTLLCMVLISPSKGNVVFIDNFNSENGGIGTLNYNAFANWTVSDGTVDLIGNGFYDFLPGNGLYVDMDGSTGNAGKMLTLNTLNLQPGTYALSFDLAGNHRNGSAETVSVKVETGISSTTYSLNQSDPFQTFTQLFTINSATSVNLSFEGVGGDNIGMLLDNVKVSAVPAPGAILLGGIGTGLVGWLRRRKTV